MYSGIAILFLTVYARLCSCACKCSGLTTLSFFFVFDYRSNLVRTKFTVHNKGVNPRKGGVLADGSNIREELGAVIYVRIASVL